MDRLPHMLIVLRTQKPEPWVAAELKRPGRYHTWFNDWLYVFCDADMLGEFGSPGVNRQRQSPR